MTLHDIRNPPLEPIANSDIFRRRNTRNRLSDLPVRKINRTEILPILLLVLVLLTVPSVHAQTTSVTLQSSPTHAGLRSDGTAQFTVTAQVTYTGFPTPNPFGMFGGSLSRVHGI